MLRSWWGHVGHIVDPTDAQNTLRLVVGALLGAVLGPPLTGMLLESSPSVLFWAVAFVVVVQTLCFVLVAMMPRLQPATRSHTATSVAARKAAGCGGEISCSTTAPK